MEQLSFMYANEMIVDNFAGGGGASLGLEWAFGRSPDIAINHDPEAVAMHMANHPNTQHYCEDVWRVDPVKAVDGRPVGFAWFSPDCKHFSKAKGGKPVSKKIRGLAWIVVKWARKVRPRVLMLENVEEFQDWGPLTFKRDENGDYIMKDGNPLQIPCPDRRGQTFQRWKQELERLGYRVEYRQLRACDYGAPTIRKRLFLIARCDGLPIVWPEPTHGDPESKEVKSRKLKPWRTAAECIDFTIPTPSIFLTKEEGKKIGVRRPLAENTMKRIARGVQRYVLDAADPFIVSYYGNKRDGEFRGLGLDEQLKTQTTENRFGLVVPYLTEHANGSSQRNMPGDSPLRTICAQVKGGHFALVAPMLVKNYGGNYNGPGVPMTDPTATVTTVDHHSLVACHLQRDFGNSVGHSALHPVGTVTAGGGGKTGLITSHLLKLRGTCKDGQSNNDPMPTVTAGGLHVGEVRAFLVKYYGQGDGSVGLQEPMHTVTSRERFGLVTVAGEDYVIADIGMRMLEPRELYRAQGFPDSYKIDIEVNGKRLSKAAQVRMCGNSVSPYMSYALAKANVGVKRRRKNLREAA